LGKRADRVVVIGGSAGSIEALQTIVGSLPPTIPAAVVIVVHVSPESESRLPDILSRSGHLAALHVRREIELEEGVIYVAPPDQHIGLSDGKICPLDGPRVNRNRPAIDPLFVSAARAYGMRAVGVLLSGYLDDGVTGLKAIKDAGGFTVVQDPQSTIHGDMPLNAIQRVEVDRLAPPELIGRGIMQGLNGHGERSESPVPSTAALTLDNLMGQAGDPAPQPDIELQAMSCPDCNGVLQAMDGPDPVRFRCRVGHSYSLEALFAAKSDEVEHALWTAIRVLEEKAEMSRSLAARLERRGADAGVRRQIDIADRLQSNADLVRNLLSATNDAETGDDVARATSQNISA
jgi:two-component system, chemotaxis family, protein-glutamate methylesterase/glutaminase